MLFRSNPLVQFDYRQIYTSIITDWFGLNQSVANQIFGENFNKISFINTNMSSENYIKPGNIEIQAPYPNPFNNSITLDYKLFKDSNVKIVIFDIKGNLVKNLFSGEQISGFKSIKWNATNNKGKRVSAGEYLAKIKIGDFTQTKKMIFVK